MRLTVLALALGVFAPGPTAALAQEVAPGRPALPIDGRRPSDVVAGLARAALSAPTDSATWAALAEALPDMALSGEADLEGTLDAARLANSLATTVTPRSWDFADGAGLVVTWISDLNTPDDLLPISLLPLTLTLGLLVLRRTRRSRRARAVEREGSGGRMWTARTLVSGGVEIAEVARRTGMAQEAVELALRLAGKERAPRPERRVRPSGRTAPGILRKRQELMGGIGRLRDGRLTYGGSAQ